MKLQKYFLNLYCLYFIMHGNLKILFLSFTLALFLAPGISLACSKKEKQLFKNRAHTETFIKQSFATIHPSCDSGDCKDECCHPKSHNCQTEGCSETVAETFAVLLNTPFSLCNFLEDSNTEASGYYSKNSNFYYQNPHYSVNSIPLGNRPK